MKKAIVTGATGFIGRFLVRELVKQNVDVIAVVRENSQNIDIIKALPIRIVECDLKQFKKLPKMIKDRDIDAVFHIAWQGVSGQDIKNQEIQIQNLQSTLDLIDAMSIMGIKTLVGAGSLHEIEGIIEMAEDKVVSNPTFMYKSAKIAAHWMGKAKAGHYGIRFFWPLINTYGEEEQSSRLVNSIIRQILKGKSPELSEGRQYYDFVYVSDVAHALYLIAEKGVDGTNYVIGSGEAKQLRDFLMVVGQVTNRFNGETDISLGFGKRVEKPIYLPKETFDVSKLVNDTGFVPKVSFEDGVERTVRWIYKECK